MADQLAADSQLCTYCACSKLSCTVATKLHAAPPSWPEAWGPQSLIWHNKRSLPVFHVHLRYHLQKHIYTVHRDDPNFHVYCSFCNRSFKKLSAYRKHTIESTYVQDDEDSEPENFVQPTLNADESCTSQRSEETHLQLDKKWLEARYILGLKEKYSITQTAIDHVVSSTASFLAVEILLQLVLVILVRTRHFFW